LPQHSEKEITMSHFPQGEKQRRSAGAIRHSVTAFLGLTVITLTPLTTAHAQKVQTFEPAPNQSLSTQAPTPTAQRAPAATNAPAGNAAGSGPRLTPAQNAALQVDYELLQAAFQGDTPKVRDALKRGANIEVRDGQYGFTPLMYAAANGHLGTVRDLIRRGARVNARSREGVQIQLGAGPTMATQKVEQEGQFGQMNWFPILLCESGGINPLMLASAGGYNLTVRELLSHGADVNYRNPDGDTALMYATFKGYLPSIQALLARGARVNDTDKYGQTALAQAAWVGHLPAVRLLLNKNARVNIKARNGWTPIEYARAGKHTAIARVLRQAAAREAKMQPKITATKPKTSAPKLVPNSPVPSAESVSNGSIIIVR
jgi:ankyrin repeat protein